MLTSWLHSATLLCSLCKGVPMDTSYRQIVKKNISFWRGLNFLYLLGGMKIKVITINTGKHGWQKAKNEKKKGSQSALQKLQLLWSKTKAQGQLRGCEDSDAVCSVTKLQKSSNKLSQLSLWNIHFERTDHWMLAHERKTKRTGEWKGDAPHALTQQFFVIFSTSGWQSPVDTGVWRIRWFQSASLFHNRVWSRCDTLLLPKNLLDLCLQQHYASLHTQLSWCFDWMI